MSEVSRYRRVSLPDAACQIDELINAANDRPLNTLPAAHTAGYDNYAWCLEGSRR